MFDLLPPLSPSLLSLARSRQMRPLSACPDSDIDYYNTFAPIAKLLSFQLILAVAAWNGWTADSFDFNSAYLNSVLDDDKVVFLEQPPNYAKKTPKLFVWHLHKALYGLKQGGWKWYEHLCEALADLGVRYAEANWGVFFARDSEELTILVIHVGDCLITGSSTPLIQQYKSCIDEKYPMTDGGSISWLLGIKITRNLETGTLTLSQHAYIDSILARFNFTDLKPLSIPMDPNIILSRSQCPTALTDITCMRKILYLGEAVRSLMYAAVGMQPDIAFTVATLAQFLDNPGWPHWEVVKRVFLVPPWYKNSGTGIWGSQERGWRLHGCRWCLAEIPSCNLRVDFLGWWRGGFLVF